MSSGTQVLFLSHGGGPLPLLGDPGHREMVSCLSNITKELHKPEAIVVISAHWEASAFRVHTAKQSPLLYDYYGFPEESYQIQYPCPGQPDLAQDIIAALNAAGLPCAEETQRGLDHGVFVPLTIMYPEADIPCLQISLGNHLNAQSHLQLGEALRALMGKNVLVIGSGFSFHNMAAFFSPGGSQHQTLNQQFEAWLRETCGPSELSHSQRWQRLAQWQHAPGAQYCHPREEHLIPLHVCYGLAQQPANQVFSVPILNVQSSMYLWQL